MTQEEVARKADITRTSLVNLEAGRNFVSLYMLHGLCVALRVDAGQLLSGILDDKAE